MKEKEVVLYEDAVSSKEKVSGNGVLVPLVDTKGKCMGILEISKILEGDFDLDEEYSCILLTNFCKFIVKQIRNKEKLMRLVKFYLFFKGFFEDF